MALYIKNINNTPNPSQVGVDENKLKEDGYVLYENGEIDYALWQIGAKTFVNNEFIDEPTEEFKANQKSKQLADLQSQIDTIDLKSIRALREGGFKDETENLTWLEYYTQQVEELRNQLLRLKLQ